MHDIRTLSTNVPKTIESSLISPAIYIDRTEVSGLVILIHGAKIVQRRTVHSAHGRRGDDE